MIGRINQLHWIARHSAAYINCDSVDDRPEDDRHTQYLGITISQDMKWTKHITQTYSRANKALGFIKRNVKVRSPRIKEKLYNSLVHPHVPMVPSWGKTNTPTRDGPTSRSTMDTKTKPPPQHQQR